jgi:hypothetical protein
MKKKKEKKLYKPKPDVNLPKKKNQMTNFYKKFTEVVERLWLMII